VSLQLVNNLLKLSKKSVQERRLRTEAGWTRCTQERQH
jgi:hypothetical protein